MEINRHVMLPQARPAVHGLPADRAGLVGEEKVSNPHLVIAAQLLPAVMTYRVDSGARVFSSVALTAFPGHHASC
jgi:hypothetical protein